MPVIRNVVGTTFRPVRRYLGSLSTYGIDAEAILDAVAMAKVEECKGGRES